MTANMMTADNMTAAVKTLRFRLFILSLIGILISSYLVFHHVSLNAGLQEGPSFCSVNSSLDCDKVAKSEYSSIFGIPIASFAMLFYLFLAFLIKLKPNDGDKTEAQLIFSLSFLSLVFTAYLAFISN